MESKLHLVTPLSAKLRLADCHALECRGRGGGVGGGVELPGEVAV